MNIKEYEEEVKKEWEDKIYSPECKAKLETIQKCKEMFKEREENLKQLIKSDILLFEQVSKCLDCEGCKKIIKLRIEELLSQLNGEQK